MNNTRSLVCSNLGVTAAVTPCCDTKYVSALGDSSNRWRWKLQEP